MKMRKTHKSREVPVEAQGKYADEEHRSHLWFLESMDRINRTIQGTDDLERTMSHALDAAFSIFGCDRAWLVYPCDPESQTWRTVIERARPGFADSSFPGRDFPMDAEVAHMHRIVRSADLLGLSIQKSISHILLAWTNVRGRGTGLCRSRDYSKQSVNGLRRYSTVY
jgi:hypothetical protein